MMRDYLPLPLLAAGLMFSAALAPLAKAQGRLSDKDVQNLMGNLKDDARAFKPIFRSALKKSTIRKTSREKDAANLADRFQKETDAMHKRFKDKKTADTELPLVQRTANQIDQVVSNLNLGPQTTSRWQKIQTELQQISSAFGVAYPTAENPRGITPYGSDAACSQSIGPERANRMVQDCLAVSAATHPPCNAQNSCSLIIDEIKRSCSLLEPRSAPAFCNEYRERQGP
jgi:hypothetical protein